MLPEPSGDWLIPTVGLGTTQRRHEPRASSVVVGIARAGDITLVVNSSDLGVDTRETLTFL